jgi:hypothetical protein
MTKGYVRFNWTTEEADRGMCVWRSREYRHRGLSILELI